jgi:hypothetical protein
MLHTWHIILDHQYKTNDMTKPKVKSYSFFYQNSLTIVFSVLFIITLVLQAFTGYGEHNAALKEVGAAEINLWQYLGSGHFIQATFENWESEFFQMALFVVLTTSLRQEGSSESKPMEGDAEKDREPEASANAPWPVRKGGLILKIYEHSLSIVLIILFLISFVGHWYGSLKDYNTLQILGGHPPTTALAYLGKSRLWFESFQNWQSEFLSIVAIVYLSIYFREKGSAQSKPVDTPNAENE